MEASSRRAFKAQQRSATPASAKRPSRAGRNLPAAIAVGVSLGALVIATALLYKPAFVALVTVVAVIGSLELVNALRAGRINAPLVPVLIGALALVPLAYLGGSSAYTLGFGLVVLAVLVWRALDGPIGAARDVAGGVFIITYVGLAGFAALMLAEPDGGQRIIAFALLTTMSDIGGYAVGVLFGKNPMAPSISPKKSWEGFAGSMLTSIIAGAISVPLLLGGDWWAGALLGIPIAFFATIGDLSESTIKRDLGIKDMGNVLPGHGGIMDRLDSLLVTAPVAWILLGLLVPVS